VAVGGAQAQNAEARVRHSLAAHAQGPQPARQIPRAQDLTATHPPALDALPRLGRPEGCDGGAEPAAALVQVAEAWHVLGQPLEEQHRAAALGQGAQPLPGFERHQSRAGHEHR
jgi:hypothetical protein